jgi:hypothetical protein
VRKRIEDTGSIVLGNTPEQFRPRSRPSSRSTRRWWTSQAQAGLMRLSQRAAPRGGRVASGPVSQTAFGRLFLGRALRAIVFGGLIDTFIDALWLEEGLAQHAGRLPARPDAVRQWLAPRAAALDGCSRAWTCRLLRRPPCANPRHHGQPAADGVQALLSAGRCASACITATRRCAAGGPPAAARAQDPDRGPGGGPAGRARRGHAAGPARPHHAGADVRQRPARERAGHAADLQRQPERRRAARAGQGQQGAPGAVWRGGRRLAARYLGRRGAILAGQQTTTCSSPAAGAQPAWPCRA